MKKLLSLLLSCFSLLLQGQELNGSWEFKMEGDSAWLPAQVPGTAHQDLMQAGRIENIYRNNNELKYQWLETKNYWYRTSLYLPENEAYSLVFEGLDTYAEVYLNDSLLGFCDNMFRRWTFDLSQIPAGQHQLKVRFLSPYSYHKETVSDYPCTLPAGSESGELRVAPFSRKAAYHFGWDWAPRIVSCGIYRKVYLEKQTCRIKRVNTTVLEIRDSMVFAQFDYELQNPEQDLSIEFQGQRIKVEYSDYQQGQALAFRKIIRKAKLWWPRGHGEAYLYHDTLRLFKGDELIDEFPFKYGLRTVELVNESDSLGTSFYFKINGKPIYAKGANYVPQDMLLPRVSNKRYHQLLTKAARANMNMLRVWGGGVYEKDIFYNLCDSLGLMVWQDFMFAGTMYPADLPGFLENVAVELRENVQRLAPHPSVVIWCGNNEIEVAWHNWGWQKQYQYSPQDSTRLWRAYQSLFDSLIPSVLAVADGPNPRPYTASSPQSNWGKPENFRHGSMHYWGVWHGGDDFEAFQNNVGRFMVEFGFQSFPEWRTLRRTIADSSMYLESEVMQNRQKSYVGNGEILRQIRKYYGEPEDFEAFVDLSQRVQDKALKIALQEQRSRQGYCMGSLLWQLNDCWPGPSWSIIDYYGNEKRAYRTVSSSFRSNFWYVRGPILSFVVEDSVELNLTLRYRTDANLMESVNIRRNFPKAGVYRINLEEEAQSQKLQSEAELRYIEAIFSNE